MQPRYPVYIISKGRADTRLTSISLEEMVVPYHIVIEPQEYEAYAAVIDPRKILILPFSNLGQGSIPARNWVWEHALTRGAARHWILDDNIRGFSRLLRNKKIYCLDGTPFAVIEDFVDRYENFALAGMNYMMFAPANKRKAYPFTLNTRIYSCILIQNSLPLRWRGRYNEDTDLSLRVLKAGLCTVLFHVFLCGKQATMSMRGGNTEDLYKLTATEDGRFNMAKSLVLQHPDVTVIKRRWGRWQHYVDYRPFAKNRPRLKPGIVLSDTVNEYGLELVKAK